MEYKFILTDEDILNAIGNYVAKMKNIYFKKAKIVVKWVIEDNQIKNCSGILLVDKELF